jgi:hypothetical protein
VGILGAEVAMISFVDSDRVRIVGTNATPGSKWVPITEVPRPSSFCNHCVVQEWNGYEIPDLNDDPAYAHNPWGPKLSAGVQYYISFLVREPVSQLPVGTLCVIDTTRPMKALPWQRAALQTLVDQVYLSWQVQLEVQQRNTLASALRETQDLLKQSMGMVEEVSETNMDYLQLLLQLP